MGKYDAVDHIGQALAARRGELGIGQEDAAQRMHVRAGTLSRWERGLMEPKDAAHIAAIARFLDVEAEELETLFFITRIYIARRLSTDLSRDDARILEALIRARRQSDDDEQ